MRIRYVLAVALVCSVGIRVYAQSAGASVRLRGTGVDRTTPGTGSPTLQAASDEFIVPPIAMSAFATAGGGSLSTFASIRAEQDKTPFIDEGLPRADASFSDQFTVNYDESVAGSVTLKFAVSATGAVDYSAAQPFFPGFATSQYSISVSRSGGGFSDSASGKVEAGYESFTGQFYREETGFAFGSIQLNLVLLSGVPGAGTFNLSMTSMSAAKAVAFSAEGAFAQGTADFGSTLKWVGLTSASLPDGTPYTGPLSITSLSGFNYMTPEPASAGLLAIGTLLMRRRVRA